MNKKFLISIILNLFLGSAAFAQFPLEFFTNSMPVKPNGPTTAPQVAELMFNPAPGSPSGTFVTASLSAQQYTGSGTGAGSPVVMFGATNLPPGSTTVVPRPVFAPMAEIGSPTDSMFSNDQLGAPVGIEVNNNYAYNLFTSVQHWAGVQAGTGGVPPTNARVYMADLTLDFSRPLNNPYIHIVAIGARSGDGLGFATEFDLATMGISLEKVVGTNSLVVTGTQINNGNATGIDVNCPNNSAACGTIRLRGNGITTVTFRVYIRGDGEVTTRWGDLVNHVGDQWMIGVSIPDAFRKTAASATIDGRIINSSRGSLKDVTLTATALSTGEMFYVTPDSYGNYRFVDLPVNDSYLIQAKSKSFRFEPDSKIVTLNGDLADIDFTAIPTSKTRGR